MDGHSTRLQAKNIGRPIPRIPRLETEELQRYVQTFLDRREIFLDVERKAGSPLYIFDSDALIFKARQFKNSFFSEIPNLRIYYALKSNSYPAITSTLVNEGFGLDVSSGRELDIALKCGASDIIFSGPGKLYDELKIAVNNAGKVTVLLDSFAELEKLEKIAGSANTKIRSGVRLTTEDSGIWRKFGIPLSRLSEFFARADSCQWINLRGLQFHLSWNLNSSAQVGFISRLGFELNKMDKSYRAKIKFIDIGGGFWPESGEWMQLAATPEGMIKMARSESAIAPLEHYKQPADSISTFAEKVSTALKFELPDDIKCTICLEPGRWLCNDAMHILLTVVDVKSPEVVITDGGTNAIGWERFETDFFPVINLSHPSIEEHECLVAGSLCTPHDLWGYSYFGDKVEVGDILLIPNQGAYTYSLRQEFIKPLPKVVNLKNPRKSKKSQY